MGTRCDIILLGSGCTCRLWKHWDGYPDYMIPFLKGFVKFARGMVGRERYWLTYPEKMGSLLIVHDYIFRNEEFKEWGEAREYGLLCPDIRPREEIRDAEYAWVLVLYPEKVRIIGYKLSRFDGLTDEEINWIERGWFDKLAEVHRKEVDIWV